MKNNFIRELRWRNMLQDIMPGTEELLGKEKVTGYIGFDPTADSLHIGSLVQIMLLIHFQQAGHKPIALVGGATGMIGDPSGKSEERSLLSEELLRYNEKCIQRQLEKFLDFETKKNPAEIVNNYDWLKQMTLFDLLHNVGKHIPINYMLAKDSVQNRLKTGISFTEFSYQLFQGYDFLYLYENKNCKFQMGGSDQWGNITTGAELIRRKLGKEAFALTCPLITKADGSKFGKTEEGNVWLDAKKTSPYRFYQFWLNASDEDAKNYIRTFTLLPKEEIEALEQQHEQSPHLRFLQKALAKEVTLRVHSENDFHTAAEASEILFGNGTVESLKNLSEQDFLAVFEGVPQFNISESELNRGINLIDFLAVQTKIFPSKGEARKMIQAGGVLVNKRKMQSPDSIITRADLLSGKYILAQKGKRNFYLVKAE